MIETQQNAFLLHSRPFKENQLLLDLLTQDEGKIAAVCYSGNQLKSNKKAIFQPFTPLRIHFKGRTALKNITLVEVINKSYLLQGNYLYSGFYLNELLVRLLPENIPCPALFEHYQQVLIALNQQTDIEILLRHFELSLLDELGLTIDFNEVYQHQCQTFHYLAEQGFVPAVGNASYASYNKADLVAIAEQKALTTQSLYTFKRLMRQILTPLLGHKPLQSRKLFKK